MKRNRSLVSTAAGLAATALVLVACTSGSSGSSSDVDSPYPVQTATFLAGPPDQAYMEAKQGKDGHKLWMLPATPLTTTWGFYDNTMPPVLRIDPGDSVAIQTLPAGGGQVAPGINEGQIETINGAVTNRGPHTVTGPIYVNGAEPGDIVSVHINRIVLGPFATNNTAKGKGLFPVPEEYQEMVTSYYLDSSTMTMRFSPKVLVPLEPFPGLFAVGRDNADTQWCTDNDCESWCNGPMCSSEQPGPWGGNMDLPEMQVGSTTYFPVQVEGALLWTGDSHAKQGNGEIDLDALETWFAELNVTVDLIKGQQQDWPTTETPKSWVAVGYDKDLDKALDINRAEAVKLIKAKRNVSDADAAKVLESTWDCRISEVVDEVLGTYCVIPKDVNAPRAADLPLTDTADAWVSSGTAPKALDAMKIAARGSLLTMEKELEITKDDAYHLATMVLDCRIARWSAGDKTVACSVPKSILKPM